MYTFTSNQHVSFDCQSARRACLHWDIFHFELRPAPKRTIQRNFRTLAFLSACVSLFTYPRHLCLAHHSGGENTAMDWHCAPAVVLFTHTYYGGTISVGFKVEADWRKMSGSESWGRSTVDGRDRYAIFLAARPARRPSPDPSFFVQSQHISCQIVPEHSQP